MATEHFCLRWNNHQSTLVSVFDNLLESGTLVDCTLAADGRYLKAHKVVLSACSPYLGMLLSQHYDKHPIIILKDVKFDELKAMLDYMYRGEVNISQEQLSTFLKAAETLQIKGLTDTGGEEGNGIPQNRPPSSNSTVSIPNDDPPSPGEGGSSPGPRKRKRNKHSDEPPDSSEIQPKIATGDASDRLNREGVCVTGTVANTGSPSSKNVSFGNVKREPTDTDGDGVMSVDDSGDSAMMSRPGPSSSSSTNNKNSPWLLSADSTAEEMQMTPGQGQYMSNMMSMYGNMWMDSVNPLEVNSMDQEMLAAYRYGRPNWNMNRYMCTTCGRTYSLQASLYNHKKFECGKMPNFVCPYCPHRTKQKGNLKTHIKKRHPEYFSEPFMPSPSRLNSMMNSIMMQQTSIMQQPMLPNSSSNPSTPVSNVSVSNPNISITPNSSRSAGQNSSQSSLLQNSSKSPNQSINTLLQAMKSLPQNSSNPNALSAANLVQALSQSLPNSTSISALDIMQVLAQGTPKSPMTPHRMSPMNASPANFNHQQNQSSASANQMSPMNASPANSNPPQSPMQANVTATVNVNGGVKPEPKSPVDAPSATVDIPKSPAATNFTSQSLDPTESEDSSDTTILPSYPVTQ